MDDDYFQDEYGDEEGGGEYGMERGYEERTYQVNMADMKTPKDKFIFSVSQKYHLYGITDSQLENIKEVVSRFKDLEFQNYNIDGLLLGFLVSKKMSKFNDLYEQFKEIVNASKSDILRYARLWTLHLNKSE